MGKIGRKTTTNPMTWDQFQVLISRMSYDIENSELSESKDRQRSKFLLMIVVGCYTGLRIGDILNLRWHQIYNQSILEISEQKTGKDRTITINKSMKSLVSKYNNLIKPVTLNEYVFTNRLDSKLLTIQYINRELKKIFAKYKIKVKNGSSHTLRKTFALRAFEQSNSSEQSLIVLSHIFNHSNVMVTRRYIGLEGEKIENIYLNL